MMTVSSRHHRMRPGKLLLDSTALADAQRMLAAHDCSQAFVVLAHLQHRVAC